ncbi:MAG: iron-sulfur cluster assembly scaffold protein [Epsilonproteobacteria bacterium]|nr:iron-sulfur cluster assembly scaffold protein [Campylobacterota bacterium]
MPDIEALKEEYIDHMMNPRNYGKLDYYSAKGIGKNPHNNELVETFLVMEDDLIVDIKFQAIGCMSTIVTGSIFTDMIKSETIMEAESVMEDFIKGLENAPAETKACGEMVAKSFMAALVNLNNRASGKEEDAYTLMISEDCLTDEEA